VQQFGDLEQIGEILDVIANPNTKAQFGRDLTLSATDNNIAVRFAANDTIITTWEEETAAVGIEIFDDTFDDSFE